MSKVNFKLLCFVLVSLSLETESYARILDKVFAVTCKVAKYLEQGPTRYSPTDRSRDSQYNKGFFVILQ